MKNELKNIKKHVFSGMSYMIPLVAGAGLMMAIGCSLSLIMGYDPSGAEFAWSIDANTADGMMQARIDQVIWYIGKFGVTLMPAFLAGFIAYSMAGKPGIAPGFVVGWLAMVMNGSFIGGIVAGLIVGYLAVFFKKNIKLRGGFQSLLSFTIIPLGCMLIGGLIYRYTFGLVIYEIMTALNDFLMALNSNPELNILMAMIIGGMMCFDFGGPVNKTAILFSYGVFATTTLPSTYAHIALAVPMFALFFTYLLNKRAFNEAGRNNSVTNLVLGCFGVGENTIPFAMAQPLLVVPSMVAGGAVAAGLAAYWGLNSVVTLSFVMAIPFIPATNGGMIGIVYWALAFFIGVAVSVILMTIGIKIKSRKNNGTPLFFEDENAGFKI